MQVAQAAYDKIRGSADVGASPQALELERATNTYNAAAARLADLKRGATRASIAAARAGLSQAQAGVQTAAGQAAQARAQGQRAAAGVKIAEAQVEQAESQAESARAQVLQARAQLDLIKAGTRPEDIAAAEAEVARAEAAVIAASNALDDAALRAPFAGTIGEVLVDRGELVTPQVPILRLGDLTRLRVRTEDLAEGDVALIRTDQPVRVTVDALPDREFQGKVAAHCAARHRAAGRQDLRRPGRSGPARRRGAAVGHEHVRGDQGALSLPAGRDDAIPAGRPL